VFGTNTAEASIGTVCPLKFIAEAAAFEPPLTYGNYFTGSNGGGTPLFAGDLITETQKIFIYVVDGYCTNQSSFKSLIFDTICCISTLDLVAFILRPCSKLS